MFVGLGLANVPFVGERSVQVGPGMFRIQYFKKTYNIIYIYI